MFITLTKLSITHEFVWTLYNLSNTVNKLCYVFDLRSTS